MEDEIVTLEKVAGFLRSVGATSVVVGEDWVSGKHPTFSELCTNGKLQVHTFSLGDIKILAFDALDNFSKSDDREIEVIIDCGGVFITVIDYTRDEHDKKRKIESKAPSLLEAVIDLMEQE